MRISDWSSDVCSSDLPATSATPRSSWRPMDSRGAIGEPDAAAAAHRRSGRVRPRGRADGRYHVRARGVAGLRPQRAGRSEEHTSELQSLMSISYAVFCLKKKKTKEQKQ